MKSSNLALAKPSEEEVDLPWFTEKPKKPPTVVQPTEQEKKEALKKFQGINLPLDLKRLFSYIAKAGINAGNPPHVIIEKYLEEVVKRVLPYIKKLNTNGVILKLNPTDPKELEELLTGIIAAIEKIHLQELTAEQKDKMLERYTGNFRRNIARILSGKLTTALESEGGKDMEIGVYHQKIGQGGMGKVFQVYHGKKGNIVAKEYHAEAVGDKPLPGIEWGTERSQRATDHPHVVRSLGSAVIEEQSRYENGQITTQKRFIAFSEWIEGARDLYHENKWNSLKGFSEAGGMSAEDRLRFPKGELEGRMRGLKHQLADYLEKVYLPLLAGVRFFDSHGLVHRDIKADNVLIDKNGQVKLSDMDLACPANSVPNEEMGGMCPGTPFYMSPEQWNDKATITEKSDVYALGILLYKTLGGEMPKDLTPEQIGIKTFLGPREWFKLPVPTEINELRDIVEMCVQTDPDKRPDLKTLIKSVTNFMLKLKKY